jgi:hypothetical protein
LKRCLTKTFAGKQFFIVTGGNRTKSVVPFISPLYRLIQVVKVAASLFDRKTPVP